MYSQIFLHLFTIRNIIVIIFNYKGKDVFLMTNTTDWYSSSSTVSPKLLDETSSSVYVYLRKNITMEEVPSQNDGEETTTMYRYLEKKVTKEDWAFYKSLLEVQNDISARMDDIEEALCDISLSL